MSYDTKHDMIQGAVVNRSSELDSHLDMHRELQIAHIDTLSSLNLST